MNADAYGAVPHVVNQHIPKFPLGRQQAAGIAHAVLSLMFPCTIFAVVHLSLSFRLNYELPHLANVICALCLLAGICVGIIALRRLCRQDGSKVEGLSLLFVCICCLVAWMTALLLGLTNFRLHTSPYFQLQDMNNYPSVDPAAAAGQQLMDAGVLTFKEGSHIDVSKSMGFKNTQWYCVAPIVFGNSTSYDFWAVGKNCCGHRGDFHCSSFKDPKAHSGLRVMLSEEQKFFRLAMQQAEAFYSIHALHPVFIQWLHDPAVAHNAYMTMGVRDFLTAFAWFFILQLFAVIVMLTIQKAAA